MRRTNAFKKYFLILLFFLLAQGAGLAVSATLNVSATILSDSSCWFKDKTANLDFGILDPSSGSDVTKYPVLEFVCKGSADIASYGITDDDGLYESGPNGNRMLHDDVADTYLPYSFSLSPISGTMNKSKGPDTSTLTVTGTIYLNDYRTALIGPYSDKVTITIKP